MSKPICIATLKPGEKFSVLGQPYTLLYVNPCRAYVQREDGSKDSIAPNTEIDVPGGGSIIPSAYIDSLIQEYEAEKNRIPPKGRRFPPKAPEEAAEEEDISLANLWCRAGCPAKMTLLFRGETITLENGLLTSKNVPVSGRKQRAKKPSTGRTRYPPTRMGQFRKCVVCGKALPKRAKLFCGIRCGKMGRSQKAKGLALDKGKPRTPPFWTLKELLELGPGLRKMVLAIIQHDSPGHFATLVKGLKAKADN